MSIGSDGFVLLGGEAYLKIALRDSDGEPVLDDSSGRESWVFDTSKNECDDTEIRSWL